jgi:branched-chain amino acid transport system ATP-binding protein
MSIETTSTEPLLDIRALCAGYGDTDVLCGVDLKVDPGEIVAVLGSNGVGKSTLNRAISGVVRARSGAILFEGAAIEHEKPAAIVARGLIHVPEGRRIFPNLSVRDNLDLGSYRRAAARRAANRDRAFAIFPRLRERRARRRHALGRRAANARYRPRSDG